MWFVVPMQGSISSWITFISGAPCERKAWTKRSSSLCKMPEFGVASSTNRLQHRNFMMIPSPNCDNTTCDTEGRRTKSRWFWTGLRINGCESCEGTSGGNFSKNWIHVSCLFHKSHLPSEKREMWFSFHISHFTNHTSQCKISRVEC